MSDWFQHIFPVFFWQKILLALNSSDKKGLLCRLTCRLGVQNKLEARHVTLFSNSRSYLTTSYDFVASRDNSIQIQNFTSKDHASWVF